MKFSELAKYLDRLEKTSSRIEITKILAELFKKSSVGEIEKIVYLSLGTLAPGYKGIVFNLAERMMLRVLSKSSGEKIEEVLALYKREGDVGNAATKLARVYTKETSVSEVYSKLYKVAVDEGEGSQERKVDAMAKVISELDPLSARFVARIPIGKLRLGFSDKTILDALSWMESGDKSSKANLEKAYQVRPDVGFLARATKEKGSKKASEIISPEIGTPVIPMLSQRLKSPSQMIEKMGEVSVEPKLDGLRLQIHFSQKIIKAFTRNLNETSWMFPELTKAREYINAKEVILDTEVVGVDEKRKTLANFQTTMTRRRKHEIESISAKIPVVFYTFDILFIDGRSLMDKPYLERRKELEKVVKNDKLLKIVDYEITKDPGRITKLNKEKRGEGLEGIMVKKIEGAYIPGRTGWRWVKMKEAEESAAKLADTVDAIIMGYTAGRGKRVGFGIGQFLVGVKDKDKIKTITKVGTGLTDEQFKELSKRLTEIKVKEKPKEYEVHKLLTPDFWVMPKVIVEIAADEITKSPNHTSGLALRFPRLVRFRDDKSSEEATTLSEVKKLLDLQ